MNSLFTLKPVFPAFGWLMFCSIAFGQINLVQEQISSSSGVLKQSPKVEIQFETILSSIARMVEFDRNLEAAYESWRRLGDSQKQKDILAKSDVDLSFLSHIAQWLKEEGETSSAINLLTLKLNAEDLVDSDRSLDQAKEFYRLGEWYLVGPEKYFFISGKIQPVKSKKTNLVLKGCPTPTGNVLTHAKSGQKGMPSSTFSCSRHTPPS